MNFVGGFGRVAAALPLLVGLFAMACSPMHGAFYLIPQDEGALQEHVYSWIVAQLRLFPRVTC